MKSLRINGALAINGGKPVRREGLLPICSVNIYPQECSEVEKVLKSGYISRGPLVLSFEKAFCEYIGCNFAVVLNSGTAALHLALRSLDLPEGSEVILPALTFVATAFAPEYCGLKPVFAEIEPDSFNISPEAIEQKITAKTKAIIPVHYGGQPARMDTIMEIAHRYQLDVISDAAHAVGARFSGQKIGSIGHATAFSFFATKNITSGEGGMITTNDEGIAEKVRRMRAHGIQRLEGYPRASGYYDVTEIGYNYHLSDVNIAIVLLQLDRLEKINEMRRKNAQYLTSLLEDIEEIEVPTVLKGYDHVFHLYTIKLNLNKISVSRDEIVTALLAEGIQVGVYYRPIHLFSYFRKKHGCAEGDLPITESVANRLITLPMYPHLTKKNMQDIYAALKKIIGYYSRG